MNYLNYNGIDYPIVTDFSVIKNVCAKLNITLSQFEKVVDNPEHTVVVFYEALKRGNKLEGKPFEQDLQYAEDLLSHPGIYFQFLKAFSEDVLKIFSDPSKKN